MSAPITTQSPASGCELLTWKNPAATGKVFGAIVAALLLVKVNFVNYLFYAAYLGLLVSAAAEYSGKLVVGQGFVTKYRGTPKTYAKCFNDNILPAVADAVSCLESKLQKIVFAQDIELTLKAAGLSYILYKLTSWFSVYSLVFSAVILAFSVPPVYQANKKEIDAAVAQYSKLAKEKTAEFSACAQKKLAPQLEALAQKTGPVGSFIKSKFPTRTAGSTVGAAPAKPVAEPSTGVTSGSSQFPEVPSVTHKVDIVDEVKAAVAEF